MFWRHLLPEVLVMLALLQPSCGQSRYKVNKRKSDFAFLTIQEIQSLCTEVTGFSRLEQSIYSMEIFRLAVCMLGGLLTLASLWISTRLVAKSSTAVLLTVTMLYSLLQFAGGGYTSIFHFYNQRRQGQKLCNMLWLLGCLGVNYTMADMLVQRILGLFWTLHQISWQVPYNTFKRTSICFLIWGIFASVSAVHCYRDPTSRLYNCAEEEYYESYPPAYSLGCVTFVFFYVPFFVIFLCLVVLLYHFFSPKLCMTGARVSVSEPAGTMHGANLNTSQGLHDAFDKDKNSSLLMAAAVGMWTLVMSSLQLTMLFTVAYRVLSSPNKKDFCGPNNEDLIMKMHRAETLVLVATACNQVLYLVWSQFRRKLHRMMLKGLSRLRGLFSDQDPNRSYASSYGGYHF